MYERRQNIDKPTPSEEAFFKRNPELAKAMKAMRDRRSRSKLKETRLEIERLVEELDRILDG